MTLFSWAPKSLWTVTTAMKLKDACSLEEKQCKPRQHIKKQRHHFAYKGPYSQSCGFPVVMYVRAERYKSTKKSTKKWCLWTVVLEKTLESPLDSKEIKLVTPKGDEPWVFIGGTNAEAEAPILWPPDVAKEPIHWKRPRCWKRLKAGREGEDKG